MSLYFGVFLSVFKSLLEQLNFITTSHVSCKKRKIYKPKTQPYISMSIPSKSIGQQKLYGNDTFFKQKELLIHSKGSSRHYKLF